MKVLFAHNAIFGQFLHFAPWLRERGHEVVVLHRDKAATGGDAGLVNFNDEPWHLENQAQHLREVENAVATAAGSAGAALKLRDAGFSPDIIIAHCGWGTGLLLKNVWPRAKYIAYHEWLYRANALAAPDTVAELTADRLVNFAHDAARNMPIVLEFLNADACWTPNEFQASQFPKMFRDKITITHDGVDVDKLKPDPEARIDFPWLNLSGTEKIVTYIGRGFEPTRGFPDFLKAIEILQGAIPDLHTVIIGENKVAYGEKLRAGDSWLHRTADSLNLDFSRIHLTGTIDHAHLRRILAAGTVHVYLTAPFVLSWSLAESMALGCAVVASDLPAVQELITDGENGLLAAPGDVRAIAKQIKRCLENPRLRTKLGQAARESIVRNFDMNQAFEFRLQQMQELIKGQD